MYSRSNKQTNKQTKQTIYFNTNYPRKVELVPLNMDYCLLQFEALIFFLGSVYTGEGALPNCNFFKVSLQILNKIIKFASQIAWMQIFIAFQTLVQKFLDVGIIAHASFQREN